MTRFLLDNSWSLNYKYVQEPCMMCVDINECVENRDICLHGRCINRPGGHQCVCSVGYKPAPPDDSFCIGRLH